MYKSTWLNKNKEGIRVTTVKCIQNLLYWMMFSTLYNKNYKIFEISFTLQQINIIKFNLLMKIIYIDFLFH